MLGGTWKRTLILLGAVAAVVAGYLAISYGFEADPPVPESELIVLRGGWINEMDNQNPFAATDLYNRQIISVVYESLYRSSPGRYEPIPWLAVGMPEYFEGPSRSSGEPVAKAAVKVRRGIRFANGDPMTAEDVLFTYRTLIDFRPPYFQTSTGFLNDVYLDEEGDGSFADPADPTQRIEYDTVIFEANEMQVGMTYNAFGIVPIVHKATWQAIMSRIFVGAESTEDTAGRLLNYDPAVAELVGTGPFYPVRFNPDDEEQMAMDANPYYHARGKRIAEAPGSPKIHTIGPFVDRIIISKYLNMDRVVRHLIEGKLHFSLQVLRPGNADKMGRFPEQVTVFRGLANSFNFLFFNTRRDHLSEAPIRQALTYLVDKQDLFETVMLGQGQVMHSYIVPSNKKFLNPDVEDYGNASGMSRAERHANAVRILREAGYTWDDEANTQGLRMPNGEPFPEIEVLAAPPETSPLTIKVVTKVVDSWQQIGVPTRITFISFGQIIDRVDNHDFDFSLLGWSMSPGPPTTLKMLFHSETNKIDGTNHSGYSNPEFDRLVDEFMTEQDEATQIELAHEIQETLVRDAPYIILNQRIQRDGVSNRFEGWLWGTHGLFYAPFWTFHTVRPAASYFENPSENPS